MKFYIEKDYNDEVVTKGTTTDDAIIEPPLIEVTEEEFNLILQYTPLQVQDEQPELTLEEQVEELKQLVADLASLQLGV